MKFKSLVSLPYQIIHACRKALIKPKYKLSAWTVSIGNYSMGGTGKTPVTIAFAEYCLSRGLKVAILLRGYKRKSKSLMVIDTLNPIWDAALLGDEAMEIYDRFAVGDSWPENLILGVGLPRHELGEMIDKKHKPDIFIVDDALQSLNLHRDCDLILRNLQESGFYREFPDYSPKANRFILNTKINESWIKSNPKQAYAEFKLELDSQIQYEDKIAIFTAIGDPEAFENMLLKFWDNSQSKPLVIRRFFPDHYVFSPRDVNEVLSLGIKVISTSKDSVKIPKDLRDSFVIARLSLELHPSDFFEQLIP